MKTLNLILQKKFANEILRGEKVREYRDYTDFYATRLIDFGSILPDKSFVTNTSFAPYKIDAIHFYWYSKGYILVECLGWAVMTIRKAKECNPEALLYDCENRKVKAVGKSLYDLIAERDEYDLDDMEENIPFIIFQLGKILDDQSGIK